MTPVASDPRSILTERIGPDWGLHLYDVSLSLGNLVRLVARQAKAYSRD